MLARLNVCSIVSPMIKYIRESTPFLFLHFHHLNCYITVVVNNEISCLVMFINRFIKVGVMYCHSVFLCICSRINNAFSLKESKLPHV